MKCKITKKINLMIFYLKIYYEMNTYEYILQGPISYTQFALKLFSKLGENSMIIVLIQSCFILRSFEFFKFLFIFCMISILHAPYGKILLKILLFLKQQHYSKKHNLLKRHLIFKFLVCLIVLGDEIQTISYFIIFSLRLIAIVKIFRTKEYTQFIISYKIQPICSFKNQIRMAAHQYYIFKIYSMKQRDIENHIKLQYLN
ncbi:hypothetical protein pb186bvf_014455 [Paramecium bursaria]